MYSAAKAAQIAAYFLSRHGGSMTILKLQKLMYLADRESMARYGEPISYDSLVSMDHGPVLSRILNLMNGAADPASNAAWDEWISDRSGHLVSLMRTVDRESLDQLSQADMAVMDDVWHKFGSMDAWTLRNWTHNNCPEWCDPQGSSIPIDEMAVFQALGIAAPRAREMAEKIRRERAFDRALASC